MKKHLLLLVVLLFSLLLIGLLSLRGEILALAFPLIIYLGVALWFSPENIELVIRREMSHQWVSSGEPITVHLTVHNVGAPVEELALLDPLPPGVRLIEGSTIALASLPTGDKHEMAYTICAPRGEYSATHTAVTAMETFGLFSRDVRLDAPMSLRVKPTAISMKSVPIRPPQTRGFSGPIPSRQGGSGVDFFLVREYQSGDPEHHINWRIAARHPRELYTNIYQMERVADVGLILDARSHVNIRSGSDSLFEHSVKAALSLSDAFLNDGNRVGLLVYGGVIRSVFPGYGKIQRERILKMLAQVSIGHNYALESLGYLPTRFFPARSQIVLISPLSMEDVPVLVQLRARGYAVMVICPDPLHFEAQMLTQDGGSVRNWQADHAYRLARIERGFVLQKARRAGVQVVDWRVDESLAHAVQKVMLGQPVRCRLGDGI
ncbi:MAG: DUF58 domain-containing protein [Anaerolineae bacterium]|nr:DUF58 domain-containing protein [Anaerolineae bacterium]